MGHVHQVYASVNTYPQWNLEVLLRLSASQVRSLGVLPVVRATLNRVLSTKRFITDVMKETLR